MIYSNNMIITLKTQKTASKLTFESFVLHLGIVKTEKIWL